MKKKNPAVDLEHNLAVACSSSANYKCYADWFPNLPLIPRTSMPASFWSTLPLARCFVFIGPRSLAYISILSRPRRQLYTDVWTGDVRNDTGTPNFRGASRPSRFVPTTHKYSGSLSFTLYTGCGSLYLCPVAHAKSVHSLQIRHLGLSFVTQI